MKYIKFLLLSYVILLNSCFLITGIGQLPANDFDPDATENIYIDRITLKNAFDSDIIEAEKNGDYNFIINFGDETIYNRFELEVHGVFYLVSIDGTESEYDFDDNGFCKNSKSFYVDKVNKSIDIVIKSRNNRGKEVQQKYTLRINIE